MNNHPKIPTFCVESSQIAEIGHEGSTLAVKFKDGGVYHYPDVSAEDFKKFKSAESLGKNFRARHFVKVS